MSEVTPCPWLVEPVLTYICQTKATAATLRPRSTTYTSSDGAKHALPLIIRTSQISLYRNLLLSPKAAAAWEDAKEAGYLWRYYAPAQRPAAATLAAASCDARVVDRFVLTPTPIRGSLLIEFGLIPDSDDATGWAFLEYWHGHHGPTIPIVLFKSAHESVIVHLNTYPGAPYVTHWFDVDGYRSHTVTRNVARTLAEHIRTGYTQPDAGERFSEIADSPRFLAGVLGAEARRRERNQQWEQFLSAA